MTTATTTTTDDDDDDDDRRSRWRAWITSKNRMAVGQEGLRFQGITYGDRDDEVASFPSKLVQDLAGNAMDTGCLVAMFIAIFVILGAAFNRSDGPEDRPGSRDPPSVACPSPGDAPEAAAVGEEAPTPHRPRPPRSSPPPTTLLPAERGGRGV